MRFALASSALILLYHFAELWLFFSTLAQPSTQTEMLLSCPACRTRYVVPDSAFGTAGRQVRCASCKHSWFQEAPLLDLVARVEAETRTVAPPAAPVSSQPEVVPPPPSWTPPPIPPVIEPADAARVADAFAPEPPFRPRRNPARLWTIAAALAALMLIVGVAGLQYLGTPTWLARLGLPVGAAEVPLLLEMPRKPVRRTTPSGNELFELSGRIINPTGTAQRVPDIMVELSDPQGRVIYGWTITPAKRTLAANESLNFDSAQIDVPKGAKSINFLFAGQNGP